MVLDRKITDDLVGSGLVHEIRAWLNELPSDRLAEFLIGGISYQDVPADVGGGSSRRSANGTPPGSCCGRCPTPSSCGTTLRGLR